MPPSVEEMMASPPVDESFEDPLIKQEDTSNSSDHSPNEQEDWNHITKPGQHDVLLGRGGGTNNHAGNVKFRKLVNEHKMRYLACSKVEKPKVAREVVQIWRKMDPPGRFLARKDDSKKGPGSVKASDNVWYEVGDKKAREKASQCLRERTPDVLPYIKQLREQQDAITEHGVSMVQQQLQMQQDAQQQQHVAYHGHAANPQAFPRRNSMPVQPANGQAAVYPQGRRGSMPSMQQGPPAQAAFAQQQQQQQQRRASLPAMQQAQADFAYSNNLAQAQPEDSYYEEMSDMEYHHSMMMMQQQMQMHQLQMQRLHQQRMQQRMQQAAGTGGMDAAAAPAPGTYDSMMPNHPGAPQTQAPQPQAPQSQAKPFQGQGGEEPIPYEQAVEPLPVQQDPLFNLPSAPVVTPDQGRANKRSRDLAERKVPDRTPSSSLMALNGSLEDGELTLEEYRQQLEDYITNNQIPANENVALDEDAGEESDLEDDWEKEKEKAYRQQQEHKRGVNRNASGCSFMSAKTTKSGISLISGISMFSDMMMSTGTRENKMNMARSVSSNLSLMSELTDLSQNIDNLSLYDD